MHRGGCSSAPPVALPCGNHRATSKVRWHIIQAHRHLPPRHRLAACRFLLACGCTVPQAVGREGDIAGGLALEGDRSQQEGRAQHEGIIDVEELLLGWELVPAAQMINFNMRPLPKGLKEGPRVRPWKKCASLYKKGGKKRKQADMPDS